MEANSSVLNQIIAATEKSKVPALDPQYAKYFADSKTLLEDIVLEQWEMNDYNKKNSKIFSNIDFSLSELNANLIPFLKDYPTTTDFVEDMTKELKKEKFFELNLADQILDGWKLMQSEQALFGEPKKVIKEKSASEITGDDILGEITMLGEDQFMQMDYLTSLVKNIDGNVADLVRMNELSAHITERTKGLKKKPSAAKGDLGEDSGIVSAALAAAGLYTVGKSLKGVFKGVGGPLAMAGRIAGAITFLWGFADEELASELTGKKIKDINIWDKINTGITDLVSLGGIFDKKETYNNIVKVENSISEVWGDILKMLPKKASVFLKDIQKDVVDFMEDIGKSLKGVSFWNILKNAGKELIDLVVTTMSAGLIQGISGFGKWANWFADTWSAYNDWVTKVGQDGQAYFDDLGKKAKESITDFGNKIVGWMSDLYKSITDLLPNSVKQSSHDAYEYLKKALSEKSEPFSEEPASPISMPLTLDATTSKQTQALAVEKQMLQRKGAKESAPIVVPVPVPSNDNKQSLTGTLSSGREEGNRALNRGLQFSVI